MSQESEKVIVNKDGSWITSSAATAMKSLNDSMFRILLGFPNEDDKKIMSERDAREAEEKRRRLILQEGVTDNGKCPVDGRIDRPVFIRLKGKRTLALSDGMGHAYNNGDKYIHSDKCLPEKRYSPSEYEFEEGLSGMDF